MATSRYGVIFKMLHIYMEMVGTTVGMVRHVNPKVIMFQNRKYSMIWISLDDDRFLGKTWHHVYYCSLTVWLTGVLW